MPHKRLLIALGILTAVGALAFVALSVAVVIRLGTGTHDFYPVAFESGAWRANPSQFSHESIRLRMADDFLATQAPVGKSRDQIVALLGEPDETPYFRDYGMVYHLGQERGFFAIDSEWLVFRVDDQGQVGEALIVRD
jgi:hypothetical protein